MNTLARITLWVVRDPLAASLLHPMVLPLLLFSGLVAVTRWASHFAQKPEKRSILSTIIQSAVGMTSLITAVIVIFLARADAAKAREVFAPGATVYAQQEKREIRFSSSPFASRDTVAGLPVLVLQKGKSVTIPKERLRDFKAAYAAESGKRSAGSVPTFP